MATLLFVDDDPLTLETLTKAVTVFGHQALIASTAEEALAIAARERPDLIFTDIRMTVMDGLQLVQALRKTPATATIPILILSASPVTNAEQRAGEAGAQEYLVKPIRLQALLDVIQKYTPNEDRSL